jgi:hypothetical protein
MECQGLRSSDQRIILKALMETKPKSLLVAAATAGMASFSGRATPVVQPYVIPHLETCLSTYNKGKGRATAAKFGHQVGVPPGHEVKHRS